MSTRARDLQDVLDYLGTTAPDFAARFEIPMPEVYAVSPRVQEIVSMIIDDEPALCAQRLARSNGAIKPHAEKGAYCD